MSTRCAQSSHFHENEAKKSAKETSKTLVKSGSMLTTPLLTGLLTNPSGRNEIDDLGQDPFGKPLGAIVTSSFGCHTSKCAYLTNLGPVSSGILGPGA